MSLWNNRKFGLMLLKEIDKVKNDKEYIYEIKFDGIRACIFVNKEDLKIVSRNGIDITYLYPELQNIKDFFNKNTIIDGEIIAFDKGNISFEKLQERSHLKNNNKILQESINNPVTFILFDVLYEKKDLIDLPLWKRKKYVEKIKDNDYLLKSRVYEDGEKLFSLVKKKGLEGIIAKKKNSKYEINARSDNWLKIKNYKINNFVIGGYEIKKNNYLSLKLGEIKKNKLFYVGSVSIKDNYDLYKEIIRLTIYKKSTFTNYNENINYVKPIIKCRVKYIEKTKNNQLRQPIIVKD